MMSSWSGPEFATISPTSTTTLALSLCRARRTSPYEGPGSYIFFFLPYQLKILGELVRT
jgi:hypothetical protein